MIYYSRLDFFLSEALWKVEDRCDKAANKAEAIEMRQCVSGCRLHEVVRMLMQRLTDFQPQADPTWLVRQWADVVTEMLEVRVKAYGGTAADFHDTVRYVVRIVVERLNQMKEASPKGPLKVP